MRVIVRTKDGRRARRIADRLQAGGVEALALAGPAASRPAPDGEDVTVLDAAPAQMAESAALAADLRARAPLALIAAAEGPAPCLREGFDAAIDLNAPARGLVRRLTTAYRDGVARAELALRGASAEEPETPAPSLLFVGAPHPAFLSLDRALAAVGVRSLAALSSFSAFDRLHETEHQALAINAMDDAPAALSLCGALRRNARLHHLPTLVLTADPAVADEALARGAHHVAAPPAVAATAGWLAEDLRRAAQRTAVEQALLAHRVCAGVSDEAAAFGAHLERAAASHHDHGRALTIGVLALRSTEGVGEDAKWRRGFREVRSLAARLIRAADTIAVLDGRTLGFLFPSTTQDGATTALQRIAAVAGCTAFAAGDDGAAVAFETRAAALAPGEGGASLLARLTDWRAPWAQIA